MTAVHLLLLLPLLHHLQSMVVSIATEFHQEFDYLKFVYDATDLPYEEEYDYIVIGGGTAGCPLAATLSENYSVLLLERGGTPQEHLNVLSQQGILMNLMQEDDGKTPVQKFTSEDGVVNARGRVLGGSSMINVGFYSRGDTDFYEKSGLKLDMDVVEKAYQWVEDSIVSHLDLPMWQSVIKNALLEAGVGPDNGFTLSHLEGTKVSGSTFDKFGRRHGAVELLNKAEQKNLHVGTHANVDRILFSSSDTSEVSAIGVIYTDSVGKSHRATVVGKGEVILSSGAIGSPQLLLLSGVGPSSYLSSLRIPVVHDNPYVGKFMFDNPRNGINIAPPFPLEASLGQVVGISGNDFYIESSSSRCLFYFPPPFSVFPAASSSVYLNLGRIMGKVPGPNSNGSLRIASSTDVKVNPIVSFNYFSDPIDLTRCVQAMRKIGEMLETPSLKQFMYQDLKGERGFTFIGPTLPENSQSDDAAMETFCRTTVTTMWHYHGGCLVGKVVDDELRVTGINALRVVDGSTFSTSPGTNPQATVMMLGRYIGLRILKERMEERTNADCNVANEDNIFNNYVCPVIVS